MIKTIRKDDCTHKMKNKDVSSYIDLCISKCDSQERPLCVINIGGPASGKTTVSRIYINSFLKERVADFCDINPDNILSKYYGNNVNCYDAEQNAPHEVVNVLFKAAVKKRCHILYDTTGINTKDIKNRVNVLLKNGYSIYFCACIIKDIKIALRRIRKRVEKTGRMIDEDYFIKRYHDLPIALKTFYFKLPKSTYEEFILFDTSVKSPRIIGKL